MRWDDRASELVVGGFPLAVLRALMGFGRSLRRFGGWDPDASHLWPRWAFLRLLGLIQLIFFLEYARSGRAMIGPGGLLPVEMVLHHIQDLGSALQGFLKGPSLLWLASSAGMIAFLSWAGLISAACQLLGFAPRAAAAVAWVCALSLVNGSGWFAWFQHDQLICETSFVAMFLAPGGWWPGLGREAPARPLAILAVRWLLFRLMFESGLGKLMGGDVHWRDFTAMDIHQETSPFPTVFGYWDHFLPHWYHILEELLMFFVELVAPLLALTGRRGRVVAFVTWLVFQAGIELTGNYGFLNLLAVTLGVMLLDDQVFSRRPASAGAAARPKPLAGLRKWIFTAPLVAALVISVLKIAMLPGWKEQLGADEREALVELGGFHVGETYRLYHHFIVKREAVSIIGSIDGGRTWREYKFAFDPPGEHDLWPNFGPYFARFMAAWGMKYPIFKERSRRLAEGLMKGEPDIVALFQKDPFDGARPTRIAFPLYRTRFATPEEHQRTGEYLLRTYVEDYAPEFRFNSVTSRAELVR